MGACGLQAAILSAGNPHATREIVTEPPRAQEVFRLWDQPIRMAALAEEKHFFKLFVAVGISAMTRVEECDRILARMPEYLRDPRVVAVGEIGLDPVQYFGLAWPLEEQGRVLEEQARIAKARGKPVILHTPTPKEAPDFLGELAKTERTAPADYKRRYLERDLELLAKVGFPQHRLVVDHADETIIPFVLRETAALVGISVGIAMRPVQPKDAARWVQAYGADRILINSDLISYSPYDVFSVAKTIREMRRIGVPSIAIRQAVFDNANRLFGLGLSWPLAA